MAWMLFVDESGHSEGASPYEVRGGVALPDRQVWSFVRAMQRLELDNFGVALHSIGKEIKGAKLLERKRFKWAPSHEVFNPAARRHFANAFLNDTLAGRAPTREGFAAYGQASIEMARGVVELMGKHGAHLFSAISERDARRELPPPDEFLRRDFAYLLERYYHLLEETQQQGLLVFDETERGTDRKFARGLQRYFEATGNGRSRAARVVPVPFFVSSDMAYPVQAADVAIYAVNHAFRLKNMTKPTRPEIEKLLLNDLVKLRYQCVIERGDEAPMRLHSMFYVPQLGSRR